MNFPFTIEVDSVKLPVHLIFEVLGFFIGFKYYSYLRKKSGDVISSSNRIWILIGAIFGSFIGSRLVGGLENPANIAGANNILLYFYSNKTVLGGFVGGLFGVEIVKKIIGEKNASGDLFTYPIILGLIIGRLGCFSMGVYENTYGIETTFFTGMDLGDGVLRHPVTLYEIGFLMLLWFFIKLIDKRIKLANGSQFKIFFITYFVFRFFCDFLKPGTRVIIGLSTIQLTCLIGLLWYIRYILKPSKFTDSN